MVAERFAMIKSEAERRQSAAMGLYGMLNGADPHISPLRRALAVWNLTIDDIDVASFHGTSTKANDKNESSAFNDQFKQLGRSKGNACHVIAQKWLTGSCVVSRPIIISDCTQRSGHPKGGAAAWMMNGVTQWYTHLLSIDDSMTDFGLEQRLIRSYSR